MASIKDVLYSQNGEPLAKTRLGKSIQGLVTYPVERYDKNDPAVKNGSKKEGDVKKIVYPATKEWHIFKLLDNSKQGGVRISNVDDVMNPLTGRVERIRLLSGVDSIWQRDQKDLPKDTTGGRKLCGEWMGSFGFPTVYRKSSKPRESFWLKGRRMPTG